VFTKRVPGVSSGNRKSSAADGSQSDWRHDQTVSSGRTQTSSIRDINSRGERPQIPWCVAVEDSVCVRRWTLAPPGECDGSISAAAAMWAVATCAGLCECRSRWRPDDLSSESHSRLCARRRRDVHSLQLRQER